MLVKLNLNQIQDDGIDSLMHGSTTFVIAHRLSTVRNSDAIMVLELGRIIERGNHNSLIAKGGKYYQLYTGAFEFEQMLVEFIKVTIYCMIKQNMIKYKLWE